ncbi:hypothetical protein HAX54_043340 [Datura stramonium]|uniref:Uncharacterized protein n=1 Tax=Datura stramonium TaxID=4076 RepID=A0ABS8SN70_DATST|nr:hypothetical protein [Datura stramonium]
MTNREEEEATFQGDNQGIEPQRKSKSSRRDKSRGRDPSAALVSEGLTQEEPEGSGTAQLDERISHAEAGRGAPGGTDEPRVEAHGGFGRAAGAS